MEAENGAPVMAAEQAEHGDRERMEEIVKAGIQTMKELKEKADTEKAGTVYTR